MITEQRKKFLQEVPSEAWFETLAKSSNREDWKQIKYFATQPDGTRVAFYQKPFIAGGEWREPFCGATAVERDSLGGDDWRYSLIKKPIGSLKLTACILGALLIALIGGLGHLIGRIG